MIEYILYHYVLNSNNYQLIFFYSTYIKEDQSKSYKNCISSVSICYLVALLQFISNLFFHFQTLKQRFMEYRMISKTSFCGFFPLQIPVIYHEKSVSNIIEIISRKNVHFRRNYVPVFFQNKCFKIAETCMMTSCNRLHATVVDKTVYK